MREMQAVLRSELRTPIENGRHAAFFWMHGSSLNGVVVSNSPSIDPIMDCSGYFAHPFEKWMGLLLIGWFSAQLGKLLPTSVGGGQLLGLFASFLRELVVPNAVLFGYLIEWGETLAGLGLVTAGH